MAKITAIEYQLAKNSQLIEDLCDSNSWDFKAIYKKTGIAKRWVSDSKESTLDLALKACNKLKKKKLKNIDTIIYVTQTADYFLPTSACILQTKLNLNQDIKCFDINQGCSGFIYALNIAKSLLDSNQSKKILIVCADTYTKLIDNKNKSCSTLFSDGASAIIVENSKKQFLHSFLFGTDGSGYEKLIVKYGGSKFNFKNINKPRIYMDGSSIYLFSLNKVPANINQLLKSNKINFYDIKMIIPHQASKLVLEGIFSKLKINRKKYFYDIKNIGNTVSSSIPIAIKKISKKNILKKNDKIILSGFGVGLSWGSCLLSWNDID